jgi:hypothetical protein
MTLLSGDRGPEGQDKALSLVPLVEGGLQAPHASLTDRNGDVELHPAPANPDAIAARLDLGNLADVKGQTFGHGTRPLTSSSARPLVTPKVNEGSRRSLIHVNSQSSAAPARGANIVAFPQLQRRSRPKLSIVTRTD